MGDMADHIEWAELPDESIHEPTSDNPSPSKGLVKATQPDIDTQIESLVETIYKELGLKTKITYATREFIQEVLESQAIKTLLIQNKIDELEDFRSWHALHSYSETSEALRETRKVEDNIDERINQLKEELEG